MTARKFFLEFVLVFKSVESLKKLFSVDPNGFQLLHWVTLVSCV